MVKKQNLPIKPVNINNKNIIIFGCLFLLISCKNNLKIVSKSVNVDKIKIIASIPADDSSDIIVFNNGKQNQLPNFQNEKIIRWTIVYQDSMYCIFSQYKSNWRNFYKCELHFYFDSNQLYCNYYFSEKNSESKGISKFELLQKEL